MKLVLKFEKGLSVPVAWCEVCNAEITNAFMAMVYWRSADYDKHLHPPLLVHKQCMSASQSRDEAYGCSMEFSTYLAFLLRNVGLTGDELKKAITNAGLLE